MPRRNISLVRELLPISVVDLSLTFCWFGLKPIDHIAVEFFDKGIGFSWRAYRHLGAGYTCVDSVMGRDHYAIDRFRGKGDY